VEEMTVVICNFNYERFLGEAIDSALAQNYVNTRVVVIDDGSTDGSRTIIEGYGSRITPIFKDNGGQVSAYNLGVQLVETDYVLFLDSDDVLYPDAVTDVMQRFERGNWAKVQFRLDVIDHGQRTGVSVPHSGANGDCKDLLLRGWLYPSPPASGNAYRASALRQIFPVPETATNRYGADFYAIYGAALVGPVSTIPKSLGGYRIHSGGSGAISFANSEHATKASKEVEARWAILCEIASLRLGLQLPPGFHDFAHEKAHFCSSVYQAPLTTRWRWMFKDSYPYLHAIVANPFWGLKKKVGTLVLSSLCLVPYSPIADYAVRYIGNPLARRGAIKH
jgi:Glycosyl transferase family 2